MTLEELSADVEAKRKAMVAYQLVRTYGKTELELTRMVRLALRETSRRKGREGVGE